MRFKASSITYDETSWMLLSLYRATVKTGESFKSYVCNVFHGKVWGDDLVAAALETCGTFLFQLLHQFQKHR